MLADLADGRKSVVVFMKMVVGSTETTDIFGDTDIKKMGHVLKAVINGIQIVSIKTIGGYGYFCEK